VDRAKPKNVVVLRRETGRGRKSTKATGKLADVGATVPIQGDYAGNWQAVIDALGVRLSDALMAGEVTLLVEGATEAILLPAMSEALVGQGDTPLDFGRVFIVNGEGGNIPHIARLLQGFGNPIIVPVDSDQGGRKIAKDLPEGTPFVESFPLPPTQTLPVPLNQLGNAEFEDFLDAEALLAAFNEAFLSTLGFECLPVPYVDFKQEQRRLLGQGSQFGWIATMDSILASRSPVLAQKREGDRFSKRVLAETAAGHVRQGKLPVPSFCKQLFLRINSFLAV
jgi:hypothetical protein